MESRKELRRKMQLIETGFDDDDDDVPFANIANMSRSSTFSPIRHILPQIPTRPGNPKMAISKASSRDPLIGRVSTVDAESGMNLIIPHKIEEDPCLESGLPGTDSSDSDEDDKIPGVSDFEENLASLTNDPLHLRHGLPLESDLAVFGESCRKEPGLMSSLTDSSKSCQMQSDSPAKVSPPSPSDFLQKLDNSSDMSRKQRDVHKSTDKDSGFLQEVEIRGRSDRQEHSFVQQQSPFSSESFDETGNMPGMREMHGLDHPEGLSGEVRACKSSGKSFDPHSHNPMAHESGRAYEHFSTAHGNKPPQESFAMHQRQLPYEHGKLKESFPKGQYEGSGSRMLQQPFGSFSQHSPFGMAHGGGRVQDFAEVSKLHGIAGGGQMPGGDWSGRSRMMETREGDVTGQSINPGIQGSRMSVPVMPTEKQRKGMLPWPNPNDGYTEAMNLSLPMKNNHCSETGSRKSGASSGIQFPSSVNSALDSSPLDAIMKMTSMISGRSGHINTNVSDASLELMQQHPAMHSRLLPGNEELTPAPADASLRPLNVPIVPHAKHTSKGSSWIPVNADVDSQKSHAEPYETVDDVSTAKDADDMKQPPLSPPAHHTVEMSDMPAEIAGRRPSDANPIKLKIRRSVKGCGQLSVSSSPVAFASSDYKTVPDEQPLTHADRPSPLALSLLGAVPSPSTAVKPALPAKGRAKTKGELKKQLFERREQRLRAEGSQASSPAGSSTMTPSPSHSHVDTLSPLSVHVDGGGISTPQQSPLLTDIKVNAASTSSNVLDGDKGEGEVKQVVDESSWNVGDMLWAKVSGHPWWPCMVSPDPSEEIFVKKVQRRQNSVQMQYHVRFYGEENERGWVPDASVMKFEGRKAFDEYVECMVHEHRRDRRSFVVNANRRQAWETAVTEAEVAYLYSRQERIKMWDADSRPKIAEASPQKSADDVNNTVKGKATKVRKLSDEEKVKKSNTDEEKPQADAVKPPALNDDVLKAVPNQHSAQFAVFCQKRRVSLRSENPQWSDTEIDSMLHEQWSQMDNRTRARFIPMGSDVIHLSDVMASNAVAPEGAVTRSSRSSKDKPPESAKRSKRQNSKECTELTVVSSNSSREMRQRSSSLKANDQPSEPLRTKNDASPTKSLKASDVPPKKRNRISAVEDVATDVSEADKEVEDQAAEALLQCPVLDTDLGADINICRVCDKVVPSGKGSKVCLGPCLGVFHSSCFSESTETTTASSMCTECATDKHRCFGCKTDSPNAMRQCVVTSCHRFYHENCIGSGERCSLHHCAMCETSSSPASGASSYFECVRCPTAYHATNDLKCLAAGSVQVAGRFIICPAHFQPLRSNTHHSQIHTTWCCICQDGDDLFGCERCPSSYHTRCLPTAQRQSSNETQLCPRCYQGRVPLYGDMVWIKFGSYRWWPGFICLPEDIPTNIVERPHNIGEFVVCFYGSHDYLWTHRGRIIPFHDKDKCSRECASLSRGVPKDFQAAIVEAMSVFKSKPPVIPYSTPEDKKPISVPLSIEVEPTVHIEKQKMSPPHFEPIMPIATESPVDWIEETRSVKLDDDASEHTDSTVTCFRCSRPGRLIVCDRAKCGKAYHLTCLDILKLPHGVWLCPWHHCVECGRAAVTSCSLCPTAYCSEHVSENVRLTSVFEVVCSGHADVLAGNEANSFPWLSIYGVSSKSASKKRKVRRHRSTDVPVVSDGDTDSNTYPGGEDVRCAAKKRSVPKTSKHATKQKSHRERLPGERSSKRNREPSREPMDHHKELNISPKRSCTEQDKTSHHDSRQHRSKNRKDRNHGQVQKSKKEAREEYNPLPEDEGRKKSNNDRKRIKTAKEDLQVGEKKPKVKLGLHSPEFVLDSILNSGAPLAKAKSKPHKPSSHERQSSNGSNKTKSKRSDDRESKRHHKQRPCQQAAKPKRERTANRHKIIDSSDGGKSSDATLPPLTVQTAGKDSFSDGLDSASPSLTAGLGLAVPTVKPVIDEPLFDNSDEDDDFPQLVIDVPTI